MKKLLFLLGITLGITPLCTQPTFPITMGTNTICLQTDWIKKAIQDHPIIATSAIFLMGIGYTKWCNKQAAARTNLSNIIHKEVERFNRGHRTPMHSLNAVLAEAQKCTNYPFVSNWKLITLIKEFFVAFSTPHVTAANIERLRDQIQDRLHGSF